MRADLTRIVMVLDRSGSMQKICSDVIGSVNAFIDEQRREIGKCHMTLWIFDNEINMLYVERDIHEAPHLTKETYVPRNQTALLDAIGYAIQSEGARLAAMPAADRPEHVIFVIVTDGKENASSEFDRDRIFDMITLQSKTYSWKFLFLAANQDAIETGASYGIGRSHTMTYGATPQGVSAGMASASAAVTRFRSNAGSGFTEEDRKDAAPCSPNPSP